MSAMTLLLGLLVVAYFGSMLVGGRALRGYGLPSGSEWLAVGFVLGPGVLGVASSEALHAFEPIAGVSMAWLALVLGAEYGYAGERRVQTRGFVVGIVGALACTLLVGGAVYAAATYVGRLARPEALCIALGLGLSSCETARYAVRWAASRSGTQGPIHDLLEDMADTDEVVPLVGMGLLFAFLPSSDAVVQLSPGAWIGVTAALGVVLGLTCAMLLRGMNEASDAWGVLVGAALLGTGIAWRLGLSPLTVMFLMGVALSLGSRHGPELRRMLARTEPMVLLPTLLLAGALVSFVLPERLLWVLGAAVVARALSRFFLGECVGALSGVDKKVRTPLALGFFSTGALTTLVALTFAFRFRGEPGQLVLSAAFVMTVVGELVGPLSLVRALSRSGRPLRPETPPSPPSSSEPTADGTNAPTVST